MASTSERERLERGLLPSEVDPGIFFHGTSIDLLEDIKREGLKCACQPGLGCTKEFRDVYDAVGYVCLTNDPKRARFYALSSTVLVRHLDFKDTLVVEVDVEGLMLAGRSKLTARVPSTEEQVPGEFDFAGNIPPELLTFYRWDDELRDFVLIE